MSNLAGSQVCVLLYMIASGIIISLIYDIFRIIRKSVKTRNIFIHIEDLIFWIIALAIVLVSVYFSNDGQIRAYLFLGVFIGALIYQLLFSRIVMKFSLLIIRLFTAAAKTVVFIVSYPFRMILRIVAPAAKHAVRIVKKNVCTKRRSGKSPESKEKSPGC